MQQRTVSVNPNTKVLVHAVHGDLRVAGWERNELDGQDGWQPA